eukprot:scaffold2858_cov659-Pavlova_lutheri.AAC.210
MGVSGFLSSRRATAHAITTHKSPCGRDSAAVRTPSERLVHLVQLRSWEIQPFPIFRAHLAYYSTLGRFHRFGCPRFDVFEFLSEGNLSSLETDVEDRNASIQSGMGRPPPSRRG